MPDPRPETSRPVLVRFKYTVSARSALFEWSDNSIDTMDVEEEDAYNKLRRIQANGGVKPA